MKVSIVAIAHNEERYIGECITSLLAQTKKADEIIVVVHNSIDRTLEIARQFPVTVIPYESLPGQVYSLCKGIETATGDIILCIDGDSFAAPNWVEEMTSLFDEKTILVGSWVKYKGTIIGSLLTNLKNKNFKKNSTAASRIWGPSFGFWGKDKDLVIQLAKEAVQLRKDLKLTNSLEDYWRALKMEKKGIVKFTNKTFVTQYTKETTSLDIIRRFRENSQNVASIDRYLSNKAL